MQKSSFTSFLLKWVLTFFFSVTQIFRCSMFSLITSILVFPKKTFHAKFENIQFLSYNQICYTISKNISKMQHKNSRVLYGNSQKELVLSNAYKTRWIWGLKNYFLGFETLLRFFFKSSLKGTNLQVYIHSWGTFSLKMLKMIN